jgi:hypothetical protein
MKKLVTKAEAAVLAAARNSNPPCYVTPHALDRLARENKLRGINVPPSELVRFGAKGRILEFTDDNEHQRPRVLTEHVAYGLRWKVVIDLKSQFVVTCWSNTLDDQHHSLDLSRYTSEPVPLDIVLGTIQKPVVRFERNGE